MPAPRRPDSETLPDAKFDADSDSDPPEELFWCRGYSARIPGRFEPQRYSRRIEHYLFSASSTPGQSPLSSNASSRSRGDSLSLGASLGASLGGSEAISFCSPALDSGAALQQLGLQSKVLTAVKVSLLSDPSPARFLCYTLGLFSGQMPSLAANSAVYPKSSAYLCILRDWVGSYCFAIFHHYGARRRSERWQLRFAVPVLGRYSLRCVDDVKDRVQFNYFWPARRSPQEPEFRLLHIGWMDGEVRERLSNAPPPRAGSSVFGRRPSAGSGRQKPQNSSSSRGSKSFTTLSPTARPRLVLDEHSECHSGTPSSAPGARADASFQFTGRRPSSEGLSQITMTINADSDKEEAEETAYAETGLERRTYVLDLDGHVICFTAYQQDAATFQYCLHKAAQEAAEQISASAYTGRYLAYDFRDHIVREARKRDAEAYKDRYDSADFLPLSSSGEARQVQDAPSGSKQGWKGRRSQSRPSVSWTGSSKADGGLFASLALFIRHFSNHLESPTAPITRAYFDSLYAAFRELYCRRSSVRDLVFDCLLLELGKMEEQSQPYLLALAEQFFVCPGYQSGSTLERFSAAISRCMSLPHEHGSSLIREMGKMQAALERDRREVRQARLAAAPQSGQRHSGGAVAAAVQASTVLLTDGLTSLRFLQQQKPFSAEFYSKYDRTLPARAPGWGKLHLVALNYAFVGKLSGGGGGSVLASARGKQPKAPKQRAPGGASLQLSKKPGAGADGILGRDFQLAVSSISGAGAAAGTGAATGSRDSSLSLLPSETVCATSDIWLATGVSSVFPMLLRMLLQFRGGSFSKNSILGRLRAALERLSRSLRTTFTSVYPEVIFINSRASGPVGFVLLVGETVTSSGAQLAPPDKAISEFFSLYGMTSGVLLSNARHLVARDYFFRQAADDLQGDICMLVCLNYDNLAYLGQEVATEPSFTPGWGGSVLVNPQTGLPPFLEYKLTNMSRWGDPEPVIPEICTVKAPNAALDEWFSDPASPWRGKCPDLADVVKRFNELYPEIAVSADNLLPRVCVDSDCSGQSRIIFLVVALPPMFLELLRGSPYLALSQSAAGTPVGVQERPSRSWGRRSKPEAEQPPLVFDSVENVHTRLLQAISPRLWAQYCQVVLSSYAALESLGAECVSPQQGLRELREQLRIEALRSPDPAGSADKLVEYGAYDYSTLDALDTCAQASVELLTFLSPLSPCVAWFESTLHPNFRPREIWAGDVAAGRRMNDMLAEARGNAGAGDAVPTLVSESEEAYRYIRALQKRGLASGAPGGDAADGEAAWESSHPLRRPTVSEIQCSFAESLVPGLRTGGTLRIEGMLPAEPALQGLFPAGNASTHGSFEGGTAELLPQGVGLSFPRQDPLFQGVDAEVSSIHSIRSIHSASSLQGGQGKGGEGEKNGGRGQRGGSPDGGAAAARNPQREGSRAGSPKEPLKHSSRPEKYRAKRGAGTHGVHAAQGAPGTQGLQSPPGSPTP